MARDFTKLLEVDMFGVLRSELVDFIPEPKIELKAKINALKLQGTQRICLAMITRMIKSNIERHDTSAHQGHNSGGLPGLQRKISLVNKTESNTL